MKKSLLTFLILITLLNENNSFAKQKEQKGLLPELKLNSTNEDINTKKSLQSEVLITRTENKAIQSLTNVIKRKKGSKEEPELWFRLAEMYMRRAKSGRFFDLTRNNTQAVQFAPPEVFGENAIGSLKRAIQIYTKIDREFPHFKEMDSTLFNLAFASQQVGLKKQADAAYYKLITQHPKSPLVPDAHLAIGEIKYEGQNFKGALEHFLTIEKYPQSRVYSYGMYKAAWAYYNLHSTDKAIDKLIEVVKYHDPRTQKVKVSHNLRGEAIRDLTIFFGETAAADQAYEFFSAITLPNELGDALITLGKLYDSHSRHKEMNVFLNEFIQRQPTIAERVKAHILLISANEAMKQRKEVLVQLTKLNDVCKKDSVWALENTNIYDESCNYDFAKANIDIAKKWWDLWLKNKQHKEIADLTQKAFKIHLDREDPLKPDSKSRYAYAELLFQLEDYRAASEQYQQVAKSTQDTQLKHDANYASLVSFERGSKKKKESGDEEQILALSKNYLDKHPSGTHALQVKFKIGFVAYESEQYDEAEKWLKPIASDETSGEFKRKSEDLVLDILNARKDFKGIKEFSQKLISQTKDESRIQLLSKIMQEAHYTEIQDYAKTAEKSQAADKLYSFYKENKSSPLAKDSLWQAIGLYYSSGKLIDGADLSREYVKVYADDKRSLDALKDAAKAYSESGYIELAAATMEQIAELSPKEAAKYIEAASELYLIDGQKKKSILSLQKLLSLDKNQSQGKIQSKILLTMKDEEGSSDYEKIENKILALGEEPYASQIKIKRIENLYTNKKFADAFNSAKTLVGNDKAEDNIRARARLVQAKVLEKEFIEQSTKTSVEKLPLVLSLKTEKLDKAQTAYLTSAKISTDVNVRLEALQGLQRIYNNYVESVSRPVIKGTLSPEETDALTQELAKLTAPIAEKAKDITSKLQSLAKENKAARSDEVDFSILPGEATVKARIRNPASDKIENFLPVFKNESSDLNFARFTASKSDLCAFSEKDKALDFPDLAAKANQCVALKNYKTAEKYADQMIRKDPSVALGTYYFSILAELENKNDKALWLSELALKKNPEYIFITYQKAKILYKLNQYAEANKLFVKAYDHKLPANELILMHGILSYAEGDCYSAADDFTKLNAKMIYNYGLGAAYAECQAQKGELNKAAATLKEQLKFNIYNTDLLLQAAFINEVYKSDTQATISAYEAAKKAATLPEMKDWIQRKLDYLNGKRTQVSLNHE